MASTRKPLVSTESSRIIVHDLGEFFDDSNSVTGDALMNKKEPSDRELKRIEREDDLPDEDTLFGQGHA